MLELCLHPIQPARWDTSPKTSRYFPTLVPLSGSFTCTHRNLTIRKAMSEKIEIDITSDTVCPWCYIGKRRLERALEQLQVTTCSLGRVDSFAEPFVQVFVCVAVSGPSDAMARLTCRMQEEGKQFEVRWHPFQLNPGASQAICKCFFPIFCTWRDVFFAQPCNMQEPLQVQAGALIVCETPCRCA